MYRFGISSSSVSVVVLIEAGEIDGVFAIFFWDVEEARLDEFFLFRTLFRFGGVISVEVGNVFSLFFCSDNFV